MMWNPEAATRLFYHDVDPARVQQALALLLRQSPRGLAGDLVATAPQIKVPKYYISCRNDRVISFENQMQLARDAGATVAAELDCGHSPFLRDEEIKVLVRVICGCVEQEA